MTEHTKILYKEGLELVFLRNEFYQLTFHKVMLTLIVSVFFNVCMARITWWLWAENIPPVYFATDPSGELINEVPLYLPMLSDSEVRLFAIALAKAATSLDYLNFRSELQNSRKYFTNNGFDSYVKALNDSRNLETLKREKLVSRGELAGEVSIKTGRAGDRFVWYVDVPINVRYQNENLKIIQPLLVHLLIGRVKSTVSSVGVQAAQIWLEDRQE